MAQQLLINPNTVARAYRELEVAGLLVKRQGAGTYVAESGSPLAYEERVKIMTDRVDALLAEAKQLDIPTDELLKLVQDREKGLKEGSKNA